MKKDGVFLFPTPFLVPEIQCIHDFVLYKFKVTDDFISFDCNW